MQMSVNTAGSWCTNWPVTRTQRERHSEACNDVCKC